MKLKLNGVIYSQGKLNGEYIGDFSLSTNIVINNNTTQTLSYYYADDADILSNYSKIADITPNGSFSYFNDLNVVPENATRIVGLDSSNVIQEELTLVSSLKKDFGTKLYSVGLLSDIHIDGNGDANDTDSGNSQSDFINALQYFNSKSVDLICINGDITYYGYDADYEAYKLIVNNYANGTPIKTIRGNHECYVNGETTYNPSNTNFQDNVNELYYEYVHDSGDVYLFCGMNKESTNNLFSNDELTWLSNKLEEHKNSRVFLFVHYYYGETGNVNGISPHSAITNQTFINLITTYKNIVYFSGHTHLAFYLQQYGKNANVQAKADICNRVHIPSCSKPRISSDGSTGSSSNYYEGSEGYLIDVYENCIVLKGIDFITGKYLPIATYCLDTTVIPIKEPNLLDLNENNWTWQSNSGEASAYYDSASDAVIMTYDGTSSFGLKITQQNLTLQSGMTYAFSCDNIDSGTYISINNESSMMLKKNNGTLDINVESDIVDPYILIYCDKNKTIYNETAFNIRLIKK